MLQYKCKRLHCILPRQADQKNIDTPVQVLTNPFVVFHVIQKQLFGKYALVLMRKMSRLQKTRPPWKEGRKLHVPLAHVLIGVLLGFGRLFALCCVAGSLLALVLNSSALEYGSD